MSLHIPALFALSLAFLLAGCGNLSASISLISREILKEPDFLNTEIITANPVPANGVAELLVAVQLKNSDNSSVENYIPRYEVDSSSTSSSGDTSGTATGVIAGNCTSSNNNGVSICILKSTQPGTKIFRLTNAKVGMEKALAFFSPRRAGEVMGIVAGGDSMSGTSAGYQVKMAIGHPVNRIRATTSHGYKAFITVQGAVASK